MPTLTGDIRDITNRVINDLEVWIQPDEIQATRQGIQAATAVKLPVAGTGILANVNPGWATLTLFGNGMQSDSVRILVTEDTRTWSEAIRNARATENRTTDQLIEIANQISADMHRAEDTVTRAQIQAAGELDTTKRFIIARTEAIKQEAIRARDAAQAAERRATTTVNGVETPTASTVAKRTARGTLRVSNPTGNDDAATKQYVDNIAARKMDTTAKVPPNQISGFPSWLTGANVYETSDGYDKLVIRNGEGAIYTAPPVDESSRCDRLAIPRGYADSRYAKKTDVKFLHLRNLNGMTTARGTLVGYDFDPSASTLALRTLAGQLTSAEPTDNTHVATKKYVDGKFGRTYSNPISGMRISRRSDIVTVYLSHADPKAVERVTLSPDWCPEWSVHGRDYNHQGKVKITSEGKIVIENKTQPVTATFTYVRK